MIGEGAAEPAFTHIVGAAVDRRLAQALLSLALGTDHQDFAAVHYDLVEILAGLFQMGHRRAQVEDVYAVAGTVDVWFHLRIPTFGLVSVMDTGIKQILHCDLVGQNFPPAFLEYVTCTLINCETDGWRRKRKQSSPVV